MVESLQTSNLPVHVIVDLTAKSGQFNMAMDEALLELGADRGYCACRIYQWGEPTVTLGFFQAQQEEQISPFPQLPTVRRLSGGGAILHDQELTYSCVLPVSHPVRHDPSQLYVMVHETLIQLLKSCGCNSLLRSDFRLGLQVETERQLGASEKEAFLCFLRQNPNDIVEVSSGQKIVGSAQRRRRGVILQHGSILVRASKLAPEIPGIAELCAGFDLGRLERELPTTIGGALGIVDQFRTYSAEELAVAARLQGGVD